MRYLIALLCPPLAVLLCGKPFQSVLSFFLTICGYFPGALHAMLVVSSVEADRRSREQIKAIKQQTKELKKGMMAQSAVAVAIAATQASRPMAMTHSRPAAIAGPSPSGPALAQGRPLAETIRDGFLAIGPALASTRAAAVRAYRELPEWAQPITWGLSAGSVASILLLILLLVRR